MTTEKVSKPTQVSACCVYDFTCPADKHNADEIKKILRNYCKKWSFQEEEGDTGYKHFQGRLSLKVRVRGPILAAKTMGVHWNCSTTSTENMENDFYCTKENTRKDGPWSDKDIILYVPRQYRGILENLRPFQKTIYDSRLNFEPRIVNVVYDENGNCGKSSLAAVMACTGLAINMPPCNDGEKLVAAFCDICKGKDTREPGVVFIDLPRSMDQTKVSGIYSAIEQIKNGCVYDLRYRYEEWWFDSPQIWVFCNTLPYTSGLSKDRWKFWTIDAEFKLQKYKTGK